MTVKELIEKLKEMDQNAIAVIPYGENMVIDTIIEQDDAEYSDGGSTLPSDMHGKVVIIS